jgi:hypothetical protein
MRQQSSFWLEGGKRMAPKRKKKRTFKLKNQRPIRFAPAPDPESIMGRISAEDGARMRSQPDLQAFVRPLVPGEFGDIKVASETAMQYLTHVYVQRVDPTTVARMRIPITAERAAAFIEGETLDVLQLQAELKTLAEEVTDDPFVLPEDTERVNIVAAASGACIAMHDSPQLEYDQRVLQARARQLISANVQIWPGITNDIEMYSRLFVPAFLFGYRFGEATLQEAPAEERKHMLARIRSMQDAEALFWFDQMIRKRMQDMGVQTIYALLDNTD